MTENIADESNMASLDLNNLYREESFSDHKVATLKKMIPIKTDGSDDTSRAPFFVAQTHVMTGAGPLPVQAKIEASTFEEVAEKMPDAIKEAVQKMIEDVQKAQLEEASRIVTPGQDKGGLHLV